MCVLFSSCPDSIREQHYLDCYEPGVYRGRVQEGFWEIVTFSQRAGTPAARVKKVPSNLVKRRSRELTAIFESFMPYVGQEGKIERIWITDIATDETHLVGHTKGYIQILVDGPKSMLGTSVMVKVTSVGRWSVFGEVIEILTENTSSLKDIVGSKGHSCSNLNVTCCANESQMCACGLKSSCGKTEVTTDSKFDQKPNSNRNQNLICWFSQGGRVIPIKRRMKR